MNKIEKNGHIYLEISDNFNLNILENKNFDITSEEYSNFIKNSDFKNQTITCNIKETEDKKKIILNILEFSFNGVEFNPDNNEFEELYSYKYKEDIFIKDNILKDILYKLDIE